MSRVLDNDVPGLESLPWGPFPTPFVGPTDQRAIIPGQTPFSTIESRATAVNSGLTRRGVIYEYIRRHPGTHVRAMAKGLRLATGDLQYHLLWLERNGLVKTKKGEFYRFVYPTMVFTEAQEVLLGVLSQKTPREIILCLLSEGPMTQGELAGTLGHSQPTVSWHMDRLAQAGVVSKKRARGGFTYDLVASREEVLRFVKSYHPEVWKRWAGRLGSSVETKDDERRQPLQSARMMPSAVVGLVGKL